MPEDHARDRHSFDRLVFFSDAVFAIAITLLVIDVRVPDRLPAFTGAALGRVIGDLASPMLAFTISFAVIGAFWSAHHRAMAFVDRADSAMVAWNLAHLFLIVLMPVPTALIARYSPLFDSDAAYLLVLLAAGLTQRALFAHTLKAPLLAPDAPRAYVSALRLKSWGVPLAAVFGLVVAATVRPWAGLAALATIPFIMPGLAWIARRHQGSDTEQARSRTL